MTTNIGHDDYIKDKRAKEAALNPPAFPISLRDYFAGQVLVGLSIKRQGACDADDARNAYSLADAMLEARTK